MISFDKISNKKKSILNFEKKMQWTFYKKFLFSQLKRKTPMDAVYRHPKGNDGKEIIDGGRNDTRQVVYAQRKRH